jgi:SAM-dependent methyltransferase
LQQTVRCVAGRCTEALERNGRDARKNALNSPATDKVFTGSIPKLYEKYLVPLIFEPYAEDLVSRVASQSLARVLEIAAGTGVVTRKLATVLPESVSIVATDLNQAMLDLASEVGTTRPVEWRQADAMQLPFEDSAFDAWCASSESCSFLKSRRRFPRHDVSSGQEASSCSTCGIESRRTNLLTP